MNPRTIAAMYAGMALATLAQAAQSQSMARLNQPTRVLNRGTAQLGGPGILGGLSTTPCRANLARKELIRRLGRRQALRTIKADRRFVKAAMAEAAAKEVR